MLNDLILLSGADIPFITAQVNIHQPTIKEISMIGEENFYAGCGILTFSKENLSEEDRFNLKDNSNFEVMMRLIMDNSHPVMRKNKVNAMMVLALLFPQYEVLMTLPEIQLVRDIEGSDEKEVRVINSDNFEAFQKIITAMFCLKGRGGDDAPDYNPGGKHAKEIAEKLAKRRQVIAEQNGEQKIAILSRYSSILSIGLKMDLNTILNYTVYQLFDQYDRFELEEEFDIYIRAQLAGASGMKEVDNWKKDIHP